MKIKVLASGSKGNCTYIETGESKILIDVGITYKKVKSLLEEENIIVSDINGILITHTHKDHIVGLSSLIKKNDVKVYIKDCHYDVIKNIIPQENIFIVEDYLLAIGELNIEYLKMSHDEGCFAFIIGDNDKQIFYVTDTGYINKKYLDKIKNMDMYLIEANHNEVMLMEGPYPNILKRRVISDSGHMSNKYAAKILTDVVGPRTENIILMHISENNNTEETALSEVEEELNKVLYNGSLIAAKQYEALEMIEI